MHKYVRRLVRTCRRLKKPFLSQLGMYRERARTLEVSFMLWKRLSSLLLQGPYTQTEHECLTEEKCLRTGLMPKNLRLFGISLMSLTTGVGSHVDVWARPYRYFQLFSWRDMERTETAGLLNRDFVIPASLTYSGSSLSRLSGETSRLLVGPSLASCFLRSLACFMAWIFRLLMWSLPYKGTLVWKSEMGSTASSRDSPSDRDNGRQDH